MSTLVIKSEGTTPTEKLLALYCEAAFLKAWSYPNPYKDDGDELCDLLVIFENHTLIFFDREKVLKYPKDKSPEVIWKRWVRTAIDAQIRTVRGAERYLKGSRPIYLDSKQQHPFPLEFDRTAIVVHRFIVAHGAKDACEESADSNVSGSLAISYCDDSPPSDFPYLIHLERTEPIHILDSENLHIIFTELDTITDFLRFIEEKERAIARYQNLMYCGEEDLLAHYLLNFDDSTKAHVIGPIDEDFNNVYIGEGEWADFCKSEIYQKTREANKPSYLWDELLQITSGNALAGTLIGNATILQGKSAIHEMAKEPRFSRRALIEYMTMVIHKFPEPTGSGIMRHVSFMPSFYPDKGYVFLQFHAPQLRSHADYREKRSFLLEVACGAAKLKFPKMKQIVGIGMDAPKYAEENEEDFILMEFSNWTSKMEQHYRQLNEELKFFNTGKHTETMRHVTEFL